jgi:hypothetical protein
MMLIESEVVTTQATDDGSSIHACNNRKILVMRKLLLSSVSAAALLATVGAANACPVGFICATGVPIWGGSGPNCTHYTMKSDPKHEYGVIYNQLSTAAADGLLAQLNAGGPVTVVANTALDEVCDLKVGMVLSIRGVTPAE